LELVRNTKAKLEWALSDPGVIGIPQPSYTEWWKYALGGLAVIVVGGGIFILSGGSAAPAVASASTVFIERSNRRWK
jgi:hypothetical protein